MSTVRCNASECHNTDKSGKIFYQCAIAADGGAAYKGKRCPGCQKGFIS